MSVIETLQELLKFDSHLPEGKRGVAEWAKAHLSSHGFECRVIENGCDPVVLASSGEPKVWLNGHLDVVPPGPGWTRGTGEIVDGRIYGRGTLDMKGPCASLIEAAKVLAGEGKSVGVMLTTDEETTMHGAKAAVRLWQGAKPEFVLVCEPTEFRAMTSEKGAHHFTVKAHGKAAHGSMPEKGVSALDALIEAYGEIRRRAEGIGSTVNLGTLRGGEKVNMVPPYGEMDIDVRFPPGHSREAMEGLLHSVKPTTPAKLSFTTNQHLEPWRAVESPGLQAVRRMAGGVEWQAPYATEATILQHLCPVAVYGPGKVDGAHKVDESIETDALERAKSDYEALVREIG